MVAKKPPAPSDEIAGDNLMTELSWLEKLVDRILYLAGGPVVAATIAGAVIASSDKVLDTRQICVLLLLSLMGAVSSLMGLMYLRHEEYLNYRFELNRTGIAKVFSSGRIEKAAWGEVLRINWPNCTLILTDSKLHCTFNRRLQRRLISAMSEYIECEKTHKDSGSRLDSTVRSLTESRIALVPLIALATAIILLLCL